MSVSPPPPPSRAIRPAQRNPAHGHKRTTSVEVSESARLELIVPQASDLDIAAAIAAAEPSKGGKATGKSSIPAIAHIEQRDSLFYGG